MKRLVAFILMISLVAKPLIAMKKVEDIDAARRAEQVRIEKATEEFRRIEELHQQEAIDAYQAALEKATKDEYDAKTLIEKLDSANHDFVKNLLTDPKTEKILSRAEFLGKLTLESKIKLAQQVTTLIHQQQTNIGMPATYITVLRTFMNSLAKDLMKDPSKINTRLPGQKKGETIADIIVQNLQMLGGYDAQGMRIMLNPVDMQPEAFIEWLQIFKVANNPAQYRNLARHYANALIQKNSFESFKKGLEILSAAPAGTLSEQILDNMKFALLATANKKEFLQKLTGDDVLFIGKNIKELISSTNQKTREQATDAAIDIMNSASKLERKSDGSINAELVNLQTNLEQAIIPFYGNKTPKLYMFWRSIISAFKEPYWQHRTYNPPFITWQENRVDAEIFAGNDLIEALRTFNADAQWFPETVENFKQTHAWLIDQARKRFVEPKKNWPNEKTFEGTFKNPKKMSAFIESISNEPDLIHAIYEILTAKPQNVKAGQLEVMFVDALINHAHRNPQAVDYKFLTSLPLDVTNRLLERYRHNAGAMRLVEMATGMIEELPLDAQSLEMLTIMEKILQIEPNAIPDLAKKHTAALQAITAKRNAIKKYAAEFTQFLDTNPNENQINDYLEKLEKEDHKKAKAFGNRLVNDTQENLRNLDKYVTRLSQYALEYYIDLNPILLNETVLNAMTIDQVHKIAEQIKKQKKIPFKTINAINENIRLVKDKNKQRRLLDGYTDFLEGYKADTETAAKEKTLSEPQREERRKQYTALKAELTALEKIVQSQP